MASASVSSIQKRFKHDVFLSFRGEDTRKTFVDHLYHALHQKGIVTYKDDEKIKKGERINEQLIRAIEESRFHIIIISKNYASSSWCLDELVKIMECQRTAEQTAIPIFYDVEPTEVRHQSGSVGEAFAKLVSKHEEVGQMSSFFKWFSRKRKRTSEDVDPKKEKDTERWRNAMKEAASLAGMELKESSNGREAEFIEKIITDISTKLHFINLSIDENLVGMEIRVKNVISSIDTGSLDVRMIGIKGIGGGGKTTLASVVFSHISIRFEGKSFVVNVREGSKGSGLKKLQKQVLQDVLNDKKIDVKSVYDGKDMMKKMMPGRKVLVVLDDVDNADQIEALVGKPSWFGPGSIIIITTRDEQVLKAHRVNFIHDVNLLSQKEAICLFSRYAFERESPNEGYEELSEEVIHYADGLPLTIKVLGSHLCGKTEREWEIALERLKTIPLKKTLEKLELSYDGLENDYKEIFLDVACILKGMEKNTAIRILESCGLHAEHGLKVLEQKSLLTISIVNLVERLQMHDHLEEMGKNIVRRLHPEEPNKHSRLWIREEIEDILVNDLGTNATRSIKLVYSELASDVIMNGLRKMNKLRALCIYDEHPEDISDSVDQYLPNTLQSLYWRGYPFTCLPNTFQAKKLVYIDMPDSKITQLWEGGEKKKLDELKFLFLRTSNAKSFDMGMTPKLKILVLFDSKVHFLNIGSASCLEKLKLFFCNDLVELRMPFECPKLKSLNLFECKVIRLNIGSAPCLEKLKVSYCIDLVELNIPVECPMLKFLKLSDSKVSSLNIGLAPYLETLNLESCEELVKLHMPVECPKLKFLYLSNCKVGSLNIGSAPCLETLNIERCEELVKLHMPVECPKLKLLHLSNCKVGSLNIGSAPCLETLYLGNCNELIKLHMPFEYPMLKFLELSGSKVSSLNIGSAPCLETIESCE